MLQYESYKEIMADRLDIRNIMNCEANINVLSNVLMEPY